jgi:type VI secretion system protein ImpL
MPSVLSKFLIPGLIILLTLGVAIWYWLRPEEDEDDDEEDFSGGNTLRISGAGAETQELPDSDESRARRSRMLALKDSLERSLQSRSGAATAEVDRLSMPWFMLVGTEGSGKKALLAATGLPLPYGPPVELDHSRKDGGRWWTFEDAIVVEAPTVKPTVKGSASDLTAAEPAQPDISESWNNLLHLLQRERPDSPLNGVVVTVSCADLTGTRRKSPEELAEQAALLKGFLDRTRRVLGVRLPVHVLITRCDIIPGFRSFAETLPERRRSDIFGWSNPNPIEVPFTAALAEQGVTEVQASLVALHDELLAAPEVIQDADGLFVFVNEFADIHDPLVDFLTKLFPSDERRPSFFFRGFSFAGDSSEQAAKAAARAEDENATLHIAMEATDAEANSLVFTQSLFADKVFKEAGLARTASRIRLSRDPRVVLSQAAAIIIAALGVFGLWSAFNGVHMGERWQRAGLRADASEMTRTLVGTSIDLDDIHRLRASPSSDSEAVRRTQDAAVMNLVTEFGSVSSSRLRSPFIPSSWVSPLPSKIESSMREGMQTVVLPIVRARLQERIVHTLGPAVRPRAGDPDFDPADPKSLTTYLAEVKELNRNVQRYNALATKDSGTTAELSALVDYLFADRSDPSAATAEFAAAVRDAEAEKVGITPDQSRAAVTRAVSLVRSVSDNAARQLSPEGNGGSDVRSLQRLKVLSDLLDPKTGIIATVSDSLIAGTHLGSIVRDSLDKYFNVAAVRVLKDPLLPEQAGARLRSVLASLSQFRFMDSLENRVIREEIPAGQKLRWDVGRLEVAIAFRSDMRRALATTSDAFSASTQSRLRSGFGRQVASRMVDVVANAQRFTPDSVSVTAAKAEADNLDIASDRLLQVAASFDSLGMDGASRSILAAAARQAEHAVALAQARLDSARYLTPKTDVVAQWRGGMPISYAALGAMDEATRDVSLRNEANDLRTVVMDVLPAIRFAGLPEVKDEIRATKLIADWAAINQSLDAYLAGDVRSTRFTFEQFIMTTMNTIDVASCQRAAGEGDTVRATPDFFIRRRTMFRASMIGRCARGGSSAADAYNQLRAVFNQKLAAHFPFVDSAAAEKARDADPAAVREFFSLYDAFARFNEPALRSDPRFRPGAAEAFAFLDQVAQARPLFAPFVNADAGRRLPEYAFVVDAIQKGIPGDRHLQTGNRTLTLNDSAQSGSWRSGEAIKVVDASGPQPVTKSSVTGTWGLLELAVLQPDLKIRLYDPDTKMELRLASLPKTAPALRPVSR